MGGRTGLSKDYTLSLLVLRGFLSAVCFCVTETHTPALGSCPSVQRRTTEGFLLPLTLVAVNLSRHPVSSLH